MLKAKKVVIVLEKHGQKRYRTLFGTVFKISACTFGGGFVIIPLMRKKFVEELSWIDEQEMIDLTAIAQSAPGAIAVNAAILVGFRVAGLAGALLSAVGTVLPPMIIITVLSFFYRTFRENAVVNMAMAGMLCGVAAVICDVVINLVRTVFRQKRILPILVMAGAFAAVRYFSVNIVIVILICGVIGALDVRVRDRRHRKGGSQEGGGRA